MEVFAVICESIFAGIILVIVTCEATDCRVTFSLFVKLCPLTATFEICRETRFTSMCIW